MEEVTKKEFYEFIGPKDIMSKIEEIPPYNVAIRTKSSKKIIARIKDRKYLIKALIKQETGIDEGSTCNRSTDKHDHCNGTICIYPVDNCSCHINPPCSACMELRLFCPKCGWEETDE